MLSFSALQEITEQIGESTHMKRETINQNYQKENNIAVVMRALHSDPACTRVKLAEATGLTQASITKIITQLIEWGTVSELESVGTGVGRKATLLHLNSEYFCVAAVRIQRDYINAAIYDMDGRLYDMARCEIKSEEGARHSADRMIQLLRGLLERTDVPVLSIGVAVPGPYNYNAGRISLMSGFPGWNEIDIKGKLENAFHLPTFVDQDANCGALAEMWYSKSRDDSDLLFICADRGIGAGLILDSSVYRGRDGFAGEIGHASINIFGPRCECGNRGCLELYSSTIALENAYRQEVFDPLNPVSLVDSVSTKSILALVRAGDPFARRVYSKTVSYLCMGIVGIINTLNPATVVFGDRITQGGEYFLEIADRIFKQYLMPEYYDRLRIRICTLDGDPLLLGASVLAYDQMLQTPSVYFQTGSSCSNI